MLSIKDKWGKVHENCRLTMIYFCVIEAIGKPLGKPLGTEFCGFLYNKQERSHKTPSLLAFYSYDSLFSMAALTNPLNKGCGRFGLDFSSGWAWVAIKKG